MKKYTLLLVMMILSVCATHAQIIGTSTLMLGDFAEIGIDNPRGCEGSTYFTGTHARPAWYLGFVANPQMDGWVNYDGDFFVPGAPENGWGIQVGVTNYANNRSWENQIPGGITSYTTIGDCIIAEWQGAVAGVQVNLTYKLITTNTFYTTTVRLTNTTAGTLNNVYYYRNFDPDNNQPLSGNFVTTNTIVAQPTAGCEKAYVTATQTTPWNSYVGLGGLNAKMRVIHGGFSNRNAQQIWDATGFGFSGVVGSVVTNDIAIALAYKCDPIPAGDFEEFTFAIVMDAASYDLAMSNLYSFSFAGASPTDECNPIVDTAYTCAGQLVDIAVVGPGIGGYDWTWSPPGGLSSTSGASTSAGPMVTTTYTITGTTLACHSTPLIKEVVVAITPSPIIEIIDP